MRYACLALQLMRTAVAWRGGGWRGASGFSCPKSLPAVLKEGPAFCIHTTAHQALLDFVLAAPAADLLSCFSILPTAL